MLKKIQPIVTRSPIHFSTLCSVPLLAFHLWWPSMNLSVLQTLYYINDEERITWFNERKRVGGGQSPYAS